MPKVKKISVRQRKAAIDKAIVAAVRDRPALFDKRDPNYMNPTKTVALWLEVAEVAQYNGDAMQRFHALKRNFLTNEYLQRICDKESPDGETPNGECTNSESLHDESPHGESTVGESPHDEESSAAHNYNKRDMRERIEIILRRIVDEQKPEDALVGLMRLMSADLTIAQGKRALADLSPYLLNYFNTLKEQIAD